MTSSPDPDPNRREDIALLHQAAEVLRKRFSRLRSDDDLHGRPWAATADPKLLDGAKSLDEAAWALGRGDLEDSRRAALVEDARGIVADTGG